MYLTTFSPLLAFFLFFTGAIGDAQMFTFLVRNKCSFPVWPAIAPNSGHPVLADGGFLLEPGQVKQVKAAPKWNGRFWGRTGCNFECAKPGCLTGDCQGLLSCNGSIGVPPATLFEVSLSEDQSKPSFYDVSLVDGYNLPISVVTKPYNSNCNIGGCKQSINNACPKELQVTDATGSVIACKSACLAFNLDLFCCRNHYGTPETCKESMYSKLFKEACPSYFSYAFDSPSPLVNCCSNYYVITFCPSKWGTMDELHTENEFE
ncbi:hypothetical protein LUZ62_047689 [Rhynchospora pubera]|uniref:Thaumatin-like protein n=1 Tax=Rhynchospora pubera TaxID=906938 RepID=A0AAV8G067_9POAL|nr:hypothetical protein LUZ62_047689 [Rhynchospora pubera]